MAPEEKDRPPEKSMRKGPDPRMIEIEKPGEVAFWMKWFGASEDELHEAVRAVGASAQSVATYFEELRRAR